LSRLMLFFLPLLLSACGVLQPVKQEIPNTYALEARFEARPRSAGLDILEVSLPRARSGYDSARMAYVRKPHELEYFTKNQWVDTPARMLAPIMIQAIDSSGAFRAVVGNRTGALANWRLETEIVRLQQDFLSTPSRMRLSIRAQLIDVDNRRVQASRDFDAEEITASEDPYGGVVAANHAVERIMGELATFCADQIKPAPKP
jgi:cholesterol transport system auxiliary component